MISIDPENAGGSALAGARARLARLAFARDSLLCAEAQRLSPARRDLFLGSYMAMRLMDDHVDHLPAEQRGPASPALARIDDWLAGIEAAAGGEARAAIDPDEAAALAMLASTMPSSPLDLRPFAALAQAMRHDAAGLPLDGWADLLAYAEGATVAPTFVFLLLLAVDDDVRQLPSGLDAGALWELARAPAVFCYLVHILRDLAKDAAAGPHLLTIPRCLWRDLAEDAPALAQAIVAGTAAVTGPLSRRLAQAIDAQAPQAAAAEAELGRHLPASSAQALGRILGHYRQRAVELGRQTV